MFVVSYTAPTSHYGGENASQSKKIAQEENHKSCLNDDDRKRLIGRKIDMIVSGYSIELSSSEHNRD